MNKLFLLLLIVGLACSCTSNNVKPNPEENQSETSKVQIPCDDDQNKLPFTAWGVNVPEGWFCSYVPLDRWFPLPYYVWKKGDKWFRVYEDSVDGLYPVSAKEDFSSTEPLRTIRVVVETFLADEKVIAGNRALKSNAGYEASITKGILFSKNNEKIVVYKKTRTPKLPNNVWGDILRPIQFAGVFKAGNMKDYLNIGCSGCTPDEFFSLVINPVIQ